MALFEGIGRVSDYAQLNNLRREAKHRVKTGQSLLQAMGAPLQISRQRFSEAQESNTKRDAERESLIRQKLRNGQKLSPMDKQYLKDKDPDLYDKVARIEERREALERALKRAKSKEEARLAVAQANISVLAEMQRGGGASSVSGAGGGGSAGAAEMPAAAANGSAAAAGDALDAPQATGADAAPTTGDLQGAIGREAVAAQSDAALSVPNAVQGGADGGHADGVQDHSCGAEKDACGNRRTPPPAEMAEMLRTAQQSGNRLPIDDERVYLLRALQREWMEYANSKEYRNLPDTIRDAAAEEARGIHRKQHADATRLPVHPAPSAAEVLASHRYYHAAQRGVSFEAKG